MFKVVNEYYIQNEETGEYLDLNKACDLLNQLSKENVQLKQQRHEWVNSVKREEIDKIFKMSIFEIAEAFEYYKKRIKEYERELQDWRNSYYGELEELKDIDKNVIE